MRLREAIFRAYYEAHESDFSEITVVAVFISVEQAEESLKYLTRRLEMPKKVTLLPGFLESLSGNDDSVNFSPLAPVQFTPKQSSLF